LSLGRGALFHTEVHALPLPSPPLPTPSAATRLALQLTADQRELAELRETLRGTPVSGQLVACARTVDQARLCGCPPLPPLPHLDLVYPPAAGVDVAWVLPAR